MELFYHLPVVTRLPPHTSLISPFAMSMPNPTEPSGAIHVHLGENDGLHRIPADLLSTFADGLQELALLAASAERNCGTKKRMRFNTEFRSQFTVEFAPPASGSFFLPFFLTDKTRPLFSEAHNVLLLLMSMLSALSNNAPSIPGADRLSPEYKARFAQAVSKFVPAAGENWFVSVEANGIEEETCRSVTFSRAMADHAKTLFENPPPPEEETMSVIGELVSVNFEIYELKIRHPKTRKEISCSFRPEIVDQIVSNRESGVQVTGRFTLDSEGFPKTLSDVTSIIPVDLSPIAISKFNADGKTICPKDGQPISLSPRLDEDSRQLFVIEDEEIGLDVFATTRDELVSELTGQLAVLWLEYAKEDDSLLTESAKALKYRLLEKFREVRNA